MRDFIRDLFAGGSAGGKEDHAQSASSLPPRPQQDAQRSPSLAPLGAGGMPSLSARLGHLPRMSGAEFERYMAEVFEALGYDAAVLGGAGDQGVDLLLRKADGLVAVQCKNYSQRIGNTPVQQVYAGKKHHGAQRAWVVAPEGFTRGALQLARSTGVELYDRSDIADWLRQADSRRRVDELQERIDRSDYRTFLQLYSQVLDSLERRLSAERQCVTETAYGPEAKARFEHLRRALYGHIRNFRGDLDFLERHNPEFKEDEFDILRDELEARRRTIEHWAKESGVSVEPANTENRGIVALGDRLAGGTTLEASPPPTPRMNPATSPYLILGDTAVSASGKKVTVHRYESPMVPPKYGFPDTDHDYVAIDVTWCAAPDSEEPERVHITHFTLQMPDNTHVGSARWQGRDPLMADVPPVLRGECVRGWITFKLPKGKKPDYIVLSGYDRLTAWVVKWSLEDSTLTE